ncbi:MAG: multicopper oxidase family protein [Firmicutes bacterium]|nr:multicopper oxidase family protein [Bacillota bacterium]
MSNDKEYFSKNKPWIVGLIIAVVIIGLLLGANFSLFGLNGDNSNNIAETTNLETTVANLAQERLESNLQAAAQERIASNLQAANLNPYEISNFNDNNPNKNITINIETGTMQINNRTINRYFYTNDSGIQHYAGQPIIANENDRLTITATNNTTVDTSLHWHGLLVDNSIDIAGISAGETRVMDMPLQQTGTYWYHAHTRPVRDQVDYGMYAPFVIRTAYDNEYSKDYILVLDDWYVDGAGNLLSQPWSGTGGMGGMMGSMERMGNVMTVNGQTATNVSPIEISTGEIVKARFINASTVLLQVLDFPFPVTVTHTDGMPLQYPRLATSILIAPGERYDVEIQALEGMPTTTYITNSASPQANIPIIYTPVENAAIVESPFVPAEPLNLPLAGDYEIDAEMILTSHMRQWMINGRVYPDTEPLRFSLNQPYVIRIYNNDFGMGMMGGSHHPVHFHANHFAVLSMNGYAPDQQILKDTVNVPVGEFVDILVNFTEPGTWMVHCHILDHEDGGMMTHIIVE